MKDSGDKTKTTWNLVAVVPDAKPQKRYGHPRFYEILEELMQLHSDKNHDYAGKEDPLSNLKGCEQMGIPAWVGVAIRINDKFSRMVNFVKNRAVLVESEGIKDTFKDMAIYAVLALILIEEDEKKGEK